ncbi:uncharacterized protein TRAVEDRAFT_154935 [Trametes versicolor FP-101664 SS1]|uniref:uncharacterized protein n=1 Tax=Trametes versicolor (strain FP-101664) TaxID=717944 RepID=UPI0004624992|nr:uncharacterized protein TRAVEDRAFT_154935 [Trametes versicolor FP-101664 SS1]EIW53435.1 hypothetical protein TRAVEDRAFT_154935 [Trametes versicolor FP-101664 SS1]
MFRFFAVALTFVCLLLGSQISAAPTNEIVARQIGNLQCNVDRLSIVAGLAKTQKTLKGLAASDNSTASSVQSVIDSISGAQGAIGVIAKALFSGATAPADARTQVQGNLTAAAGALSAINSTDTATAASLQKALSELSDAATAGEGVVANCK